MKYLGMVFAVTGAIVVLIDQKTNILSVYLVALGIFSMSIAILDAVEKRK